MKVQLLSIVLPIVYHNRTHAFLPQLFPLFFAKSLFNFRLNLQKILLKIKIILTLRMAKEALKPALGPLQT